MPGAPLMSPVRRARNKGIAAGMKRGGEVVGETNCNTHATIVTLTRLLITVIFLGTLRATCDNSRVEKFKRKLNSV